MCVNIMPSYVLLLTFIFLVTQVANENVEISANPAYSSVILHYSNTDYETVF